MSQNRLNTYVLSSQKEFLRGEGESRGSDWFSFRSSKERTSNWNDRNEYLLSELIRKEEKR